MDLSLLVLDAETRGLFAKFSKIHPEGSKDVFKLVLKTYLKLADKSVRKGQDPLLVFEDLIERICTGKLYRDVKDKIDYLDSLLESNHENVKEYKNSALFDEIREIKSIIRGIELGSSVSARRSVAGSMPKDALKLIPVDENAPPKERKNYRNVRDSKSNKKIKF
ncbi:MAG: hypothetical protein HQK54_11215 [Oligoflexales bacterium]|nr:hypothetical protein [Oligoflexales bacterium]